MSSLQFKPEQRVKIVAFITAVCLLGDSMLYIVLPLYYEAFGLTSLWEVGVLLAVNRFVRIPLHPIVARFYMHTSIRNGLMISLILTVITTASYGLLTGFWLFFVARCLWGVAWALLRQGGQLTVVECIQELGTSSGRLTGSYLGLSRIGSLLGMLLGGLLIGTLGREWLSLGFAVAALFAVPWVYLIIAPELKSKALGLPTFTLPQKPFRELKTIWILLVTGFIVAMLFQGMLVSTVSYWVSLQDLSPVMWLGGIEAAAWAGLLLALRWLWDPFLSPLIGTWTDQRQNRKTVLIYTAFAASILFMLLPMTLPPYLWLLNMLIILVSVTVFITLEEAWYMEETAKYSESRHKLISIYAMSTDFGAALGPIVAYSLITFWGQFSVSWLIIALLISAVLLWSKIELNGRRGYPWKDS